MPSETFCRLPEVKKKRIMEAVEKELTLHPISEVSINKIIQSAGISRGSFYQYFTDKYDMLGYVLNGYRQKVGEKIGRILDEQSGDVFCSMEIFLSGSLEFAKEQRNNRFYHNLFSDMEAHKILCKQNKKINNANYVCNILKDKANLSALDINDDQELLILVEMVLDTCARGIMELLVNKEGEALDSQIISHFHRKMKVIERGFQKNQEEK